MPTRANGRNLPCGREEAAHVRRDLDAVAVGEAVLADELVHAIAEARRAAAAERERGGAVEPVLIRQLIEVVAGDAQPARRDAAADRDAELGADALIADARRRAGRRRRVVRMRGAAAQHDRERDQPPRHTITFVAAAVASRAWHV